MVVEAARLGALLPDPVHEWLRIQEWRSVLPQPGQLLVETFPRGQRHYLVCYPFEGRLAHQTLGMLLTRRLERAGPRRTDFPPTNMRWRCGGCATLSGRGFRSKLFDEDMLGDDLDAWLAESNSLQTHLPKLRDYRRTDRTAHPVNSEKTGRQVTFSSDLDL